MDRSIVKKIIAMGLGVVGFGLAAFVGMSMQSVSSSLKSFDTVRTNFKSSELFLLDRNGKPLHQWRQDKQERVFHWASLNDVSPAMIEATLKSEDKNFFSHYGVDTKAMVASLYQRIFKDSRRGGSTITMQVAKLVAQDRRLYQGLYGKWLQFIAAIGLESKWSKNQILEAYLNLASFRGEHRGISSVAWILFGKSPSGLTTKEATLLSVLLRSPNATDAEWTQRACWQEPSMCDDFKSLVVGVFEKSKTSFFAQGAFHLAQRLSISGHKGELTTSVDKDLQLYVQELIQSQIRNLESQNVHDAAVLVVENKTGQVWAYVGGAGLDSTHKYVDGIQSLRQAGSTLKPFLYATAFERNVLHKNSWIEDSAVDIVFDRGVYKPQNHDRQFYGWVQAKMALGSSLNVPAVKVFKLLNDDLFWSKLKAMEFRELKEPEHYGPALALGVADVTLESLTQAYRTLAQGGMYSPLQFDLESKGSNTEVFTKESASEVTDVLSQSENRVLGFGLDSSLSVPGTAVKTGTSKDMRDNWCIGYGSRFTVGVWVGNFNGEPMWNVMGVTGAAPIWKKVMEWLHEKYPESFELANKAEDVVTSPQVYPQARIVYPQDGMVLALDPAIPKENQRLPLLVEAPHMNSLYWKIDGKKLAISNKPYLWSPRLGKHTFELYQDEELKEKIQILVK